MRRNRIKLKILSQKQLDKLHKCNVCNNLVKYGDLRFYVDESNISITNNSNGICEKCYNKLKSKNYDLYRTKSKTQI